MSLGLVASLTCQLLAACSAPDQRTPDQRTLPDATVVPLDGGAPASLKGLIRRPTFVNLWASYCAPCLTEMPLLQAFADSNPEIDVIGVTDDPSLEKAKEVAMKTGVSYRLYQDENGELLRGLAISNLPATVLVDERGTLVWSHTGIVDHEMLQRAVEDGIGRT